MATKRRKPSIRKPKPATTTRRPCMTCRSEFKSTGPGNRMCDACRREATYDPHFVYGDRSPVET